MTMRDALDRCSWPARRWLADRLVGQHAYSRNAAVPLRPGWRVIPDRSYSSGSGGTITFSGCTVGPFDQERI
jgi:hypothetical protein